MRLAVPYQLLNYVEYQNYDVTDEDCSDNGHTLIAGPDQFLFIEVDPDEDDAVEEKYDCSDVYRS